MNIWKTVYFHSSQLLFQLIFFFAEEWSFIKRTLIRQPYAVCLVQSAITSLSVHVSTVAGGNAGVLSQCQSGAGGLQAGHEDGRRHPEGALQAAPHTGHPRAGENSADGCARRKRQMRKGLGWFPGKRRNGLENNKKVFKINKLESD